MVLGISNIYSGKVKVSAITSFKGNSADPVSVPMDKAEELKQQNELASKECAYATKATAMAQILTGNDFKYSTTVEDYEKSLIKQGKIPNKHFFVESVDDINSGTYTRVVERNSDGEKTKETTFCRDNKHSSSWNEQSFYSPKNKRCPYKSINYTKDGCVEMTNYNIAEEEAIDFYIYRPDGSLGYYHNYKNKKGMSISKDGKITKLDLIFQNG